MLFLHTSTLKPLQREIISKEDFPTLIDFLQEYYPNGFDKPTDIYTRFGTKIEVSDYDMKLNEDDIVVLVEHPMVTAALVGGSAILAWLANTAIMMAVNFAVSKLFAPDTPSVQSQGSPSSVYSLNNAQNQAKLGQPIPVGYGSFRMYPSYIEQPYYKYENNDEYLYLLLAIGQGRYSIDKLMIDNMDVTHHADVQYKLINKENFHDINGFVGYSEYNMRNNLLSTPTGYEVKDTESEFFEIDNTAWGWEFDFVFPRGLLQVSQESDTQGQYVDWSLNWEIKFYNENKVYQYNRIYYAIDNTPTPKRLSFRKLNSNIEKIKYIKVRRLNPDRKDSRLIDTLVLERVKDRYSDSNVTEYGDMTLLWVRLKATNAISSAGQQRVNGFFTRTDKPNDIKSVLTDIYTNKDYGARLNHSDLDLIATPEKVNGVIETQATVWDTMNQITKAQKYTVYPVGQDILLKHDAPNNITTALFDERNILRGTFKVQYSFKDEVKQYDCIEVQYREASTWDMATRRYPASGIMPQTMPLFGVTDNAIAEKMAKYFWKQDASRRKVVSFDTDIEGFTLEFLDKIKIQHSAVGWTSPVEFLVVKVTPKNENSVSVEAVLYDADIYV